MRVGEHLRKVSMCTSLQFEIELIVCRVKYVLSRSQSFSSSVGRSCAVLRKVKKRGAACPMLLHLRGLRQLGESSGSATV